MRGQSGYLLSGLLVAALAASAAGCGGGATTVKAEAKPEPLVVETAHVESRTIDRYLRVTGSLVADEQAEVSAEAPGRVIAMPVERGSRVAQGAVLARISRHRNIRAATRSGSQRGTDRGAPRLVARTAVRSRSASRTCMNAKASLDLAEAEFTRIKSLLDQKVVSQSEYDQRRAQVDAARQQFQMAQNVAEQSYRSLQAARARIELARKAQADTTIRAPFCRSRRRAVVSVGDYVTRGAHVATVVRVDPMRVELTVPEQAVSLVKAGQPVRIAVDAYPGETFAAKVRYVSPSLRTDQRALTVEAVAANADGRLKPGLFATASIQQPASAPALLVPATAVETIAGTSRVYVVKGDKVEERIVTLGETVGTASRNHERRRQGRDGRRGPEGSSDPTARAVACITR